MSSPHVLVVDDEADIRASIQDILSDESYGVTVAANAAMMSARPAAFRGKWAATVCESIRRGPTRCLARRTS